MTNNSSNQHEQGGAARRPAPVPAIGAPRPGSFWQRWKEWEREHGTVPAPVHERAA